mgnify:CR=1 FL=1
MEIIGLNEDKIKKISSKKQEDDWVLNYRLKSYENFLNIDMPKFGPKVEIDFGKVIYYKSNDRDDAIQSDWNSVLKPVVDELD